MKKSIYKHLATFFAIVLLWKIVSLSANPLVLPPPENVVGSLGRILISMDNWRLIGNTALRAFSGLGAAVIVGSLLGLVLAPLAGYIRPAVTSLQNVPLIGWVLLGIIWFGFTDTNVSFVVFVAALPIIYLNTLTGVEQTDSQLLEMARSFRLSPFLCWYGLSLPTLASHLSSGVSVAIAIMWKSVVMAELLSSRPGIGTELGIARSYLQTENLMAWILLLAVFGLLTESLWRRLAQSPLFPKLLRNGLILIPFSLTSSAKDSHSCAASESELEKKSPLLLKGIEKGYIHDGQYRLVLQDVDMELESGDRAALMGPSGVGKTTLLHLMAGLLQPERGEINLGCRKPAVMFQEPRLLPWFTAEENIILVLLSSMPYAKAQERSRSLLQSMHIAPDLYPHQLSGGMKQVVSLARALASGGGLLLLDEPFRSSDQEQRQRMWSQLLFHLSSEDILIAVTHQPADVAPYASKSFYLAGEPASLQRIA